MDKKGQDEDSVSFSNDPSPGLSSSTSDNKTSRENQRESEISAISSERVQSDLQTSVKSDLGSQAGKDTKDSNTGRAEVSLEEPTKKAPSPYNQLKALSSSSKESGDLVQLNSVDFVNPKPCLSSNENTASGCSHISDGSLYVIREEDHMKGGKNGCNFDLNEEGMEPLHVVAKFGVLIGQPEKPLQFGGELGWRSSITTSAFRPTFSSKNSPRENGVSCGSSRLSLASQGIDLNVAFTMDSEPHENHSSKHCEKQGVSRFDLNDSPVIEDSCKNTRQMGETRDTSRNYVLDSRSPSYWVDMRSIQGFNHVQSGPFLVTAPSYEQLQMVVPIQSEISFMPSTFYPPGILPYLNNNHRPMTPMIPHFSGSVVTHPQVLYPATHITPDFRENGGMAIMAPLSAKRREPEGGWDYSRVNYRQMGSRK